MAQELEVGVHGEADLIEIATRLACEGYWQDIKQVMEVSRVISCISVISPPPLLPCHLSKV
jgi:hypothetical protein